ncbi:hypothetical protein [Escherichia coli]|uniref:hypothetical protein n=1 Tax=Escherichia coli TaxID=562 RepID=UPI003F57E359
MHKNKGKFQARISVNKKRIYLGRFNSPEVAAVARDSAARLFHGEFALCNSPTG